MPNFAESVASKRGENAQRCGEMAPVVVRYWGSHFKTRRQAHEVAQEFRSLSARKWRCHFVLRCLPEDPGWLKDFRDFGVQIHCEPRPTGNFDFGFISRMRQLTRRLGATVFHCENLHTSPLIGAAWAGVPVRIWTKRAMNSDFEQCRRPSLKERLAVSTKVSSCLATRVIAVSRGVKGELVSMGIPETKIMVRHNPCEVEFDAKLPDRQKVRTAWGCSESEVVIVSVGHAVPVKGWDVLLNAFSNIASAAPRCRLILVGSTVADEERRVHAQLRDFVAARHLEDQVLFAGQTADIPSVLRAADVFAMPSRSEGFGIALVEAIQAGLPCIASRVGIAEDVIAHGVNGFLVERCDVPALAEALLKIISDHALRRRLAEKAVLPSIIPTLEQYSEQLARDYETLLQEALGGALILQNQGRTPGR